MKTFIQGIKHARVTFPLHILHPLALCTTFPASMTTFMRTTLQDPMPVAPFQTKYPLPIHLPAWPYSTTLLQINCSPTQTIAFQIRFHLLLLHRNSHE